MQQKHFRSQFVHTQPEKAGDENVDTRNKAGNCRNCHDFSHEFVLGSTLRQKSHLCPNSWFVAYSSMWPAAFRNGFQVYKYAVSQR